jgi:hypothetical protein
MGQQFGYDPSGRAHVPDRLASLATPILDLLGDVLPG